mgnify:CR=1 FL=1
MIDGSSETIRVLHVDDDPSVTELASEFLQREDDRITVETAADAKEGLDRLQSESVDCIVSDYEMPGQNGIEFLQTVRETEPDLPFILFTGRGSEEVASDAISAGVTDYLQKEKGTDQYTVLANRIVNAVGHDRSQQLVEQSQRRYQAIFDDPNILVGLLDTDGSVLDVNETAIEYVSKARENLTGTRFWETPWFAYSDLSESDVQEWIGRAANGEYVNFEADLQTPAGDPYTVEGVFRPVRDEDGAVVSIIVSAREITERKARERELEEYEAYLEGSSDIITVLDETGQIKYQSPSATRILGYEQDELIGENGFDLVHPDDVETLYETFTALVEDPSGVVTSEARFRSADGEWRWLEVRGRNELEHPVISGIITNNRDITERKAYEDELEQTNALLSTLFGTLPVGVLAEDSSRNVLATNERLLELFGFSGTPESLAGADCDELAAEASDLFVDADAFTDRIETLIEERDPVRDERLELRDGRTFERRYEPIELPGGEGHLWVYSDITEQETREQKLEALNETTRELMAAETHQEVADISAEAARDILGMDANALYLYDEQQSVLAPKAIADAGRAIIDEPPTFETDESIAWRVFESGDPVALDDVHEDSDIYNSESPIESELYLPVGDGGILIAGSDEHKAFDQHDIVLGRILASNTATALDQVDQTERLRERERELSRQNERLEEFASVVSHDLQSPLQVADGRLELLRDDCESEHIEPIETALERMETLIEDLLTLAREGNRVQELEAVQLASLFEDCWKNVDTDTATLDVQTERTIEADPSRLKQLFENLVRNAIEHGGPEVTVTVGDTDTGFFLADDGPGIPAEKRAAVFEAGYSTTVDGTGFGLAIVKEIVDAHGWSIQLTESAAGGLRVEIDLGSDRT